MKYFQFYLVLWVILLFGCGADNPFSPIEKVSMSEVVSDAINSGDLYENEKIKIRATILFDHADLEYIGGISLETGDWNVTFFITDYESPKSLNRYKSGNSYTFTLYIEDIEFGLDGWTIWAEEI